MLWDVVVGPGLKKGVDLPFSYGVRTGNAFTPFIDHLVLRFNLYSWINSEFSIYGVTHNVSGK